MEINYLRAPLGLLKRECVGFLPSVLGTETLSRYLNMPTTPAWE